MAKPYKSTMTLRRDNALSEITSNDDLKADMLENLGLTDIAGSDRQMKVEVLAVTGAALHAANLNWQNPESVAIIVHKVILDVTTASTGASTIDVGYTPTSATTSSDTMLDGVSGTPAAVFDSSNAALDSGANAKAQRVAVGKWITVDEASGDVTGMVANLYIHYSKV